MPKGTLSSNFFESFKNLGSSAAKTTAEALGAFSPLKIAQEIITPQTGAGKQETMQGSSPEMAKKNSTPLNLNRLQETYHKRDEQEAMKIQQRLFQMVNSDSSNAIANRQRNEQARQDMFTKEHDDRIRMQHSQPDELETVVGKASRGARHAPQKKHTEIKPSAGKH